MSQNSWGQSWGRAWGHSWGLTWEANQDELEYGRATNPNLKLIRIHDVRVSGTGASLQVTGGSGGVTAGVERSIPVRIFGVGAILSVSGGSGGAAAETHVPVRALGTGAQIQLATSYGEIVTGFGCPGAGAVLSAQGGQGGAASGISVSGGGNEISISTGTLDDVFSVKNPTDEELAAIAYHLYKRVA